MSELEHMLRDIYGSSLEASAGAQRVMASLQVNSNSQSGSAVVDKGRFHEFIHSHPALLFPAFEVT